MAKDHDVPQIRWIERRLRTLVKQLNGAVERNDQAATREIRGRMDEIQALPMFSRSERRGDFPEVDLTGLSSEEREVMVGARLYLNDALAAIAQVLHAAKIVPEGRQWSIAIDAPCGFAADAVLRVKAIGDESTHERNAAEVQEESHAALRTNFADMERRALEALKGGVSADPAETTRQALSEVRQKLREGLRSGRSGAIPFEVPRGIDPGEFRAEIQRIAEEEGKAYLEEMKQTGKSIFSPPMIPGTGEIIH